MPNNLNNPKAPAGVRAWRVVTDKHNPGSWVVYSGDNPKSVKYRVLLSLKNVYSEATFSWIKKINRAVEYDELAAKYPGKCIAWKAGTENFEIDKGIWYDTSAGNA